MKRRVAIPLLVAALLPGWAALSFADGQERLMKEAAKELISLNDEMLKGLNIKPEELADRKLYVKAHVQPKEGGASEIKVDALSLGEPERQLKAPEGSLILKGTLKAQPDRTWKLSIDDAIPQSKPGPAQGKDSVNGKKDK